MALFDQMTKYRNRRLVRAAASTRPGGDKKAGTKGKAALARSHSKAACRPRFLSAERHRVWRDSAALAVNQEVSPNLKSFVSHPPARSGKESPCFAASLGVS
jgi:hypothetical protein